MHRQLCNTKMHFSKILGATALFHVTLFATVSHGRYYNHPAFALSPRVDVTPPKGGDPNDGGSSGSGTTNTGRPAGANPDSGNPNTGNSNTGQDTGSPANSAGSGNSGNSASSRASDTLEAAQKDPNSGLDLILTDEEYKSRGQKALQMNQDAINAKPPKDKTYNTLETLYQVIKNDIQPDDQYDLDTITGYVQLDSQQDWTFVEVLNKQEEAESDRVIFQGYVRNDQRSIIATGSYARYDTNTGTDKLPNSEIMYQSLETITEDSAGSDPSKLESIIRAPIANKGSLQMMARAVQAKKGMKADLTRAYTFDWKDKNFNDLVGDYWTAINGLDNARPSSYMAADHPVALKGLQVTQIIVWPQLPSTDVLGAMIVQMGRK